MDNREESSLFRLTLIFSYALTNLQFVFEFIFRFIIRERTLCSNEVENLLVVTAVANVSSNQFGIPYHAPYLWSALKQKIPLAFNTLVHFQKFRPFTFPQEALPIAY